MLHEAEPCTCRLLYGSCGGSCSLLFAGNHQHYYGEAGAFAGGPYGGSSVDCTLSLGTPSTRRAEAGATRAHPASGGGMQWEQPGCNSNGRQQESAAAAPANASARRCANCDTTSTPLWRNGPRGPKSLCNACGIRYKKEERRAAAAPTSALASDGGMEYAAYGYAARQQQQWGCYGPAAVAKAAAASFGMFGDKGAEDGPCLPWGLGVMPPSPAFGTVREMPSLFQYCSSTTR